MMSEQHSISDGDKYRSKDLENTENNPDNMKYEKIKRLKQ